MKIPQARTSLFLALGSAACAVCVATANANNVLKNNGWLVWPFGFVAAFFFYLAYVASRDNTDKDKISRLAMRLIRRSECLDPNAAWMKKAEWASLLNDDANSIDDVLISLRKDGLVEEMAGLIRIGPPKSLEGQG